MHLTLDIIVIGSGPGGYVAAIRAAQLGYNVGIVEKYKVLGGTCTNVGCIPSKALLDSSEHFYNGKNDFEKHGIILNDPKLNFSKFIGRKDLVVQANNDGLAYLMKKNKIQTFYGTASFISNTEIEISTDAHKTRITSRYYIIATGSKPKSLPGIHIDKKQIITSTEALRLPVQPKSMTIIGGGIIGVEIASIYSRIGTTVTILEYTDSLIPSMDQELGKGLFRILKKQGINILLNAQVSSVKCENQKTKISFNNKQGVENHIDSELSLIAVGRKPYTEGLGLEKAQVDLDELGFVKVNDKLQTSVPHIYAIGDVIGGKMLAHKAEEEGVFVAEVIDGQKPHINYNHIPEVVYTWPEGASVGYTEQELLKKDIPYRIGKFPIGALGRARAGGEKDGFVKVLSEPKYGEVLGIHILGPRAADLIAQAVVAMEYEVRDIDMAKLSYAHPTYSEAMKEAFLDASGRGTINI